MLNVINHKILITWYFHLIFGVKLHFIIFYNCTKNNLNPFARGETTELENLAFMFFFFLFLGIYLFIFFSEGLQFKVWGPQTWVIACFVRPGVEGCLLYVSFKKKIGARQGAFVYFFPYTKYLKEASYPKI